MAVRSGDQRSQGETAATDSARFIGNATLLIRYGSLTILTDPNFVHRDAEVSLGFGLTTTRLTDPAVDIDDLPRPDVVILSHDHGDHFDAVAADWLDPATPIVTCPGAAAGLAERGFRAVRPLATWERLEFERDGARVRITAVPARHAPGPMEVAMPEVLGSVLELWRSPPEGGGDDAAEEVPADLRLYVSGDTVLHDELDEIRARFGEIDLAFIHLGGMRVMGVTVSLDAVDGVELIKRLRPRLSIPIHYNDYGTSKSTLAEFVSAVNEAGLADRVRYLQPGDGWPLVPRAD